MSTDYPSILSDTQRRIVESIFAWLLRTQRLVVDYQRIKQTSETPIKVAMIRLVLARLGRWAERIVTHAA
jgi:hypothetical protein